MNIIKKEFTLNGKVVTDTGKRVGAYHIFEDQAGRDDYGLVLHFVDIDQNLVGTVSVEADMGQGTGYVSGYEVVQV